MIQGQLLAVDAPEWTSLLDRTAHDFYHLPGYVALCAAQERGRACALHVTDGRGELLLPLVIRDIEGGGIDAISPYGYPGPIHTDSDPEFLETALEAGREILEQEGLVSAFIRLHPLLNPTPPNSWGTLVEHGSTVSIDLSLPSAEIWGQMRLNHRRDIVRATRLGFVARMDEGWEHLEGFQRLYRSTMERRGAAPFYLFDREYVTQLREALGDRLHLCVVEEAGAVRAAGLFAVTGSIVEYHLSGMDTASPQLQPVKLMLYYVAMWAKERGCEVLHLGGGVGGGQDPLLHFKQGFSPRRHSFRTLRLVINPATYRRLVHAAGHSPDAVDVDGFFPQYRRAPAP